MRIATIAANAFAAARSNGATVSRAAIVAREAAETGRSPICKERPSMGPNNGGTRFAVEPSAFGLRFVGWSDVLYGRGIDHTGWFMDSDTQEDVCRGAVFALPGRHGRARYVSGYRQGSNTRNGWSDMSTLGESAIIDLSRVYVADDSDTYQNSDALRSAARAGDESARIAAESEREYREAWDAGVMASQKVADAKALRLEARAWRAEWRALPCGHLPYPAAIRAGVLRNYEEARSLYKSAESMWGQFPAWERPTWADSYQTTHGRDPFPNGNPEIDRLAEAFREGAGAMSYWESRRG